MAQKQKTPDVISADEMAALLKSGEAKPIGMDLFEPSDQEVISAQEMDALIKSGKAKPVDEGVDLGGAQTFLESAAQALTFGNLPKLQAAVEQRVAPKLTALGIGPGATDVELQKRGFKIEQPPQDFVTARDINIERMQRQAREHPIAAGAGTVAGLGLTIPAFAAVAPAAAATKLGRAVQGIKAGAGVGFIADPGSQKGVLDPIQLEERLKNAVQGGAVGGVSAAVLGLFGVGAQDVGEGLGRTAARRATKALGGIKKKEAAALRESGQDVRIGRQLLEQGAIPRLGTPGRILKRIEKGKEEAGKKIGDIIDDVGDVRVVDSNKVARAIENDPEFVALAKIPGRESLIRSAEPLLETLRKSDIMTMRQALSMRQGIDGAIKDFDRLLASDPTAPIKQQVLFRIRTAIRNEMNDVVNEIGKGEARDRLLKANRIFSNLESARGFAVEGVARGDVGSAVSLGDKVLAAGALGAGADPVTRVVTAGVVAALSKMGRTFGSSAIARATDFAAKTASQSARVAKFANENPTTFAAFALGATREDEFDPNEPNPVLDDPKMLEFFEEHPLLLNQIKDDKTRAELRRRLKLRRPSGAIQRRLGE
jgi:hypothetical protein